MKHRCFSCRSFIAYYEKGYCRFIRTDCGHCQKLRQTVNKHSTCENWEGKSRNYRIRSGVLLKELAETLTKINGLKLILEELEKNE